MIPAPIPENELERLSDLYSYDLLDSEAEEQYNDIVNLAASICGTPISTITLIDYERQWFKAKLGIQLPETPREHSFCAHNVASEDDLLLVEDATQDVRFHDNPFVIGEPNIKFYAGISLKSGNGNRLGSLCVIDDKPRKLTQDQINALGVLSKQVMQLFELRKKNKDYQFKQMQLEQKVQMQNKVIAILAHDIRNPVASLKNIIDLNNEGLLTTDDIKEMLNLAEQQLDRVLELIDQLLEWGKIQLDAVKIKIDRVNLLNVINKVAETLEHSLKEKNNQLIIDVPSEIVLNSDENVLHFIFRNLITNANKFTQDGTITVSAQIMKDKVHVSIVDTGVGMDEMIRKRIFDDKKPQTTLGTKNEKGTGLGLMLTMDFIELLGGSLLVQSERGKGSNFTIVLSL